MPSGGIRTAAARVGRRLGVRRREAWPLTGVVDDVRREEVAGWLWLPRNAEPVLVELLVGRLVVTWTHTQRQRDDRPMRQGVRRRARRDSRQAWRNGEFPVASRFGRHTTAGELHTFSFRLQELWPYARRSTRISVRVNGRPLPIAGHGMFLNPPVDGRRSPKALRSLLNDGYVLNQRGRLTLNKSLDLGWQRGVGQLYERVRAVLDAEHGLEAFLIYGSLLGAVREGGPIGHDDDLDVAYLSAHRDGAAAADELEQVALTLIHHGFHVEALLTHLNIADPDDPSQKLDVFNCYFDEAGQIAFPFGVAGTAPYSMDDWKGLETISFLERPALVPATAERLLNHVYGDDWRRPRPGFRWTRSRTQAATEGRLSVAQRTRVHWADFYSRHGFDKGSSFSRFVLEREDLPRNILEIGCGDGRDACAMGVAGRPVTGLDASAEGVERATAHAEELGLEKTVTFAVCDAEDQQALRRHLEEVRSRVDGPLTCYMRFFLHAIPENVQHGLLQVLDECGRPGDALAVEFRTSADAQTKKAHGEHFRRYVDAEGLRLELEERYGFAVDHFVEGRGLSPYGEEDPVLCRIIAHRPAR